MRSFRKFLFKNETVSILLILQAALDGFLIAKVIDYLVDHNLILFKAGTGLDTISLIHWGFISSWMFAILLVSFIFGISIINRGIFFKQLSVAVFFYAAIQAILFGIGKIDILDTANIVLIFGSTSLAILAFRSFLFIGYKALSLLNRERNIIIIGCNAKAELLSKSLNRNITNRVQLLGFFDNYDPDHDYFKPLFLGYLEEVKSFCISHEVKEIYYTLGTNKEYIHDLSEFADQHFIFLGIVPDLEIQKRKKIDATYLEDVDIPIITYRYTPLQHNINFSLKRVFDVLFSSMVILVLGPIVLPLLAILIKLDSKGPIFFVQKRPGKGNQLFDCYKFRTMVINHHTEVQARKNDNRVTRIGTFLRKTSLDELPQFYNVLKGDMSIVGPRPNLISQLNLYSQQLPEYSLRHIVSPGITGFAQISGLRGEIKESSSMEKRLEHDLEYMQNWSLGMDIKIIFKTIVNMFVGDEKAY